MVLEEDFMNLNTLKVKGHNSVNYNVATANTYITKRCRRIEIKVAFVSKDCSSSGSRKKAGRSCDDTPCSTTGKAHSAAESECWRGWSEGIYNAKSSYKKDAHTRKIAHWTHYVPRTISEAVLLSSVYAYKFWEPARN